MFLDASKLGVTLPAVVAIVSPYNYVMFDISFHKPVNRFFWEGGGGGAEWLFSLNGAY